MAASVSVRLDEGRATLEADAKQHGIDLATYLRNRDGSREARSKGEYPRRVAARSRVQPRQP
jgi:hypothetical protein